MSLREDFQARRERKRALKRLPQTVTELERWCSNRIASAERSQKLRVDFLVLRVEDLERQIRSMHSGLPPVRPPLAPVP